MGLIRKLALPFKGKGGFIGSFLIDYLIFGEDLIEQSQVQQDLLQVQKQVLK